MTDELSKYVIAGCTVFVPTSKYKCYDLSLPDCNYKPCYVCTNLFRVIGFLSLEYIVVNWFKLSLDNKSCIDFNVWWVDPCNSEAHRPYASYISKSNDRANNFDATYLFTLFYCLIGCILTKFVVYTLTTLAWAVILSIY